MIGCFLASAASELKPGQSITVTNGELKFKIRQDKNGVNHLKGCNQKSRKVLKEI